MNGRSCFGWEMNGRELMASLKDGQPRKASVRGEGMMADETKDEREVE